MKKLMVVIGLLALLSACSSPAVNNGNVEFGVSLGTDGTNGQISTFESITVNVGTVVNVNAEMYENGELTLVSYKSVWTSSNEAVATIQDGDHFNTKEAVTHSTGTTKICATYTEYPQNDVYQDCNTLTVQ